MTDTSSMSVFRNPPTKAPFAVRALVIVLLLSVFAASGVGLTGVVTAVEDGSVGAPQAHDASVGNDTRPSTDRAGGAPSSAPAITNATREIENTTVKPGGSTVVTVHVETDATSAPAVYERFGAGFSNVEVVSSEPPAVATEVDEANERLFAVWNSTDTAVLEYELTVPSDAEYGDSFTVEGLVDVHGDDTEIDGKDEITVGADIPIENATRAIEDTELEPGESTLVTVEVGTDMTTSPAVYESFSPRATDVEVVDGEPSPAVTGVRDDEHLFAVWNSTDTAVLEYEVTVPETFEDDAISFDGEVETANGTATVAGHDEINVYLGDSPVISEAERAVGTSTLEPGGSTMVTVEVETSDTDDIAVYEEFDPKFADAEIVEYRPTTVVDAVTDDRDALMALWESTDSVTLEYELTVPSDADDGDTFSVEGEADIRGDTVSIGTDEIVVEDWEEPDEVIIADATREIENTNLEPGESTVVTVEVETDGRGAPAVYEEFDTDFAEVEVLDENPSSKIKAVTDDEEEMMALWEDTDSVTLEYELTVPSDAEDGDAFSVEGEADVRGDGMEIDGPAEITVGDEPTAPHITNATRRIGNETVEPGGSTTVTVDVETDASGAPAVYERFGAGFSSVEVVSAEPPAVAAGVDADNENLFAVWNSTDNATLTYEVTPSGNVAGGNVSIEGEAETARGTAYIEGTDTVAVGERQEVRITNATREIGNTTVEPGGSTVVTVHVKTNATSAPAVYERFGAGFSNVEVVSAEPPAVAAGVDADNENLFAVWNSTDNATLTYEVTPSGNVAGGNVTIVGEADTADGTRTVDRTNLTVAADGTVDWNETGADEADDTHETVERLPGFVPLTALAAVVLVAAALWSRRRNAETD